MAIAALMKLGQVAGPMEDWGGLRTRVMGAIVARLDRIDR